MATPVSIFENAGAPQNERPVPCPICRVKEGRVHRAKEMMLGIRDVFFYQECSGCGCLFRMTDPGDMSRYYPSHYYSLQSKKSSRWQLLRARVHLSPLSFLVDWRPRTDLDVIHRGKVTRSMRLLEVGCGSGQLLSDLRQLGYQAEGVDPFVAADIFDDYGRRVRKETLTDVNESYDVLLFRHSLEHMPLETLAAARARLKPGGLCIVCIPLIGWAWEEYQTAWVQLDAPRHTFLHTLGSFTQLAEQNGLRLEQVVFDSNDFQFWGSEAYRKDISLDRAARPGRRERSALRQRARRLNRDKRGDTAQFFLRATH